MNYFRRHEEKAESLKRVPLFANLTSQQLEVVSRIADEVRSEPGDLLTREGRLGHEFLLIVEGSARVEQDGATVAQLGPGDYLGEMALIDGKPRTATAITEAPSLLLVVESRAFQLLLDEVPDLRRELLLTLCERVRRAEEALPHARVIARPPGRGGGAAFAVYTEPDSGVPEFESLEEEHP
jgi:CRP/FNR family cyclic AMP-dependent transcriptional regulator